MLTEFGKILRKLRIDRQELLRDMAKNLEVSSAYLSAVETGKRKILPKNKRFRKKLPRSRTAGKDFQKNQIFITASVIYSRT